MNRFIYLLVFSFQLSVFSLSTKANVVKDTSVCKGTSILLKASDGISYKWSSGDVTQSIRITPTNDTVYTVTITYDNSSTLSEQFNIKVLSLPVIVISKSSDSLKRGDCLQLKAEGGINYIWYPTKWIFDDYKIPNPHVCPSKTTYFYVKVIGQNGCIAIDSVKVAVYISGLFIPNTFTPNGKGKMRNG
jgi:hypothetical protein